MKKKGKLKTIVQAFTTENPVNEKWYQDRMKICAGCEYNSDNIKDTKEGFVDKVKAEAKDKICGGKPHCTACGCCIDKKAGEDTETCGLKEIGLEPKWYAFRLETSDSKDLNVINESPEIGQIDLDITGSFFKFNIGETSLNTVPINLILERTKGLTITKLKAACGCTAVKGDVLNNTQTRISLKLSTTKFGNNSRFEKNVTVSYKQQSITKSVIIKLIGKKVIKND